MHHGKFYAVRVPDITRRPKKRQCGANMRPKLRTVAALTRYNSTHPQKLHRLGALPFFDSRRV